MELSSSSQMQFLKQWNVQYVHVSRHQTLKKAEGFSFVLQSSDAVP